MATVQMRKYGRKLSPEATTKDIEKQIRHLERARARAAAKREATK